jgi:hypothetical protein
MLVFLASAFAAVSLSLTGSASAFPNYPPPTTTTTVAPVTVPAPAAPLTPTVAPSNPTAATAAFDQIVLGNAVYAPCVTQTEIRAAGVLSQERYVGAAPAGVILDGNWLPGNLASGFNGNYGCAGGDWPAS